jgi:SagB-type dehydrogenase family enzyme
MVRGAPHDGDPDVGYLISLWVAPEARGRGIGAALVGAAAAWARGAGLRRLVLDVGVHNAAARRLYEGQGFLATGATGALPPPRAHLREIEMAVDLQGGDAATASDTIYAGSLEVPSMTDDAKAEGGPLIRLPEPSRTGAVSLEETLARRRSLRSFAADVISLQAIGQLAWSAQGVTDDATGYRTAPSAGGTLPVEVDLLLHGVPELVDGVYRYHPGVHALHRRLDGDRREVVTAATLNQGFVAEAPVVVVLSAVPARIVPRFGALSDRLIDMEIGHVGQNVSLQAVALGLGTVVVAAFREADLAAALELAEGERPVYLMPVGRAA